MIETRSELLKAIQKLPANVDFPPRSYKDVWIGWLSEYRNPVYGRTDPNRDAEFIFNALNSAGMIIWLAAASGLNPQIVRKANSAIDRKDSRVTQAAAVRRVLPWSLVAERLERVTSGHAGKVKPVPSNDKRNPPWTRDELILALDLYLVKPASPPGKTSKDVLALSEVLNKLGAVLGESTNAKFRNANGVYMKMMNFRRFDPEFTGTGKVGLTRGNKDEKIVWEEFAANPQHLRDVAAAIRKAVTLPANEISPSADDDEVAEAEEGRLLTRLHRYRERSRKLVDQRKKKALHERGCLRCEACDFDFEERYGKRGMGFIEAHHTKPVETLVEGSKTKLEDLALLCANCHRMIHSARPWLTIDELRKLIT